MYEEVDAAGRSVYFSAIFCGYYNLPFTNSHFPYSIWAASRWFFAMANGNWKLENSVSKTEAMH
jgi:hypothetical protein